MKSIEIWCWGGIIKPEDRSSSNMCGPTRFFHKRDAQAYVDRLLAKGGELHSVRVCENATHGFLSIEEYDRLGKMTADELNKLRHREVTEDMVDRSDMVE